MKTKEHAIANQNVQIIEGTTTPKTTKETRKKKKTKNTKNSTPHTTVKKVRRLPSQLEDQLSQYWHRIYTLEARLQEVHDENSILGAKVILAIYRNDTTILEELFDTTPAPMSCDLEPDIRIGHDYSSQEPTAEKFVYQGLQERGSFTPGWVSEHHH